MNDKKMMRGMSILMVLLALVMVASGVQAQEAAIMKHRKCVQDDWGRSCTGPCRNWNWA